MVDTSFVLGYACWAMNKVNRTRGTERYTWTVDRVCKCGHTLGNHTAARAKAPDGVTHQPCIIGDFNGGDVCECACFYPADRKAS